ncbi:LOW QUALITY PROTEIN: HLA class II histocompatibility antigen, DM beta chain-like [Nyctibius grandis]|uniref:LOW QUALITY PROTEIN: HLA class II histocompatibility antigen, DM beta chain-like n=1 Tax=Nyctibius grandis TaxID=48427 RepID=UPI0035BBB646
MGRTRGGAGRRRRERPWLTPRWPWMLGVLALSCGGAGAFLVHVASSCPLVATGSAPAFGLTIVFNKNPLVCYDPGARRFVPCDWGLLHGVATAVASGLNNGSAWVQRAEARRRACRDLAGGIGVSAALRRAPPQIRIVPVPLPTALLLTCHVWGFYPPEVTVRWLRNGDAVASGDITKLLPNGDWTYQTRVTLRVAAEAEDTFTCWVQHPSLERPLHQDWGPGLSPGLAVKVAVAAVTMTVGLVVFAAGTFSYCRQAPGEGWAWGHAFVFLCLTGPGPGPDPGPKPGPGPGSRPGPGSGPSPSPDPDPGPVPVLILILALVLALVLVLVPVLHLVPVLILVPSLVLVPVLILVLVLALVLVPVLVLVLVLVLILVPVLDLVPVPVLVPVLVLVLVLVPVPVLDLVLVLVLVLVPTRIPPQPHVATQ